MKRLMSSSLYIIYIERERKKERDGGELEREGRYIFNDDLCQSPYWLNDDDDGMTLVFGRRLNLGSDFT